MVDLSWAALPAPVGGGSVLVAVGEDGGLIFVDAAQLLDARSQRRRLATFRNLIGGHWPYPQVRLEPSTIRRTTGCMLPDKIIDGKSPCVLSTSKGVL